MTKEMGEGLKKKNRKNNAREHQIESRLSKKTP